jgi:transcriptional regulator with XRE-family HTH domain
VKYIRNDRVIKKLGKKIRTLRKEQNISQSQLSFESNIRINQIGRIERGEINTSISTIIAIAEALNVELKDLFDF